MDACSPLRELRKLSNKTILEAAGVIPVSATTLRNVEIGHGKLTAEQTEKLKVFYHAEISARLLRLAQFLHE